MSDEEMDCCVTIRERHCLDAGMSDEEMNHCVTIRDLALPGYRYVR